MTSKELQEDRDNAKIQLMEERCDLIRAAKNIFPQWIDEDEWTFMSTKDKEITEIKKKKKESESDNDDDEDDVE
jgi:hypothetical protein